MLETRQLILRDLADRGIIDDTHIAEAHRYAADHLTSIIPALIAIGRVTQRELALARARVSEHPFVDLNEYVIETGNACLLQQQIAERSGVFPIFVVDGVATIAMLDPHDLQLIELIRQATHHEVEPVVCEEPLLRALIQAAYAPESAEPNDSGTPSDEPTTPNAAPIEASEHRDPIRTPDRPTQEQPDYEQELDRASRRTAGLTLITSVARHASTARLLAFNAEPITQRGHAVTLKRFNQALDEAEGPLALDGLDDDLIARAAADAALQGRHIIATMTAADASDAIDRLRVAGVTRRTLDAIEISVFHIATTPDGLHAIVDVAGHPIFQRTPTSHAPGQQPTPSAAGQASRRLSA